MKKSTKLIVSLSITFFVIAGVVFGSYLFIHSKQVVPKPSPKLKLSYFVSEKVQNNIAINKQLAGIADPTYYLNEINNDNADIVVADQKTDNSKMLANKKVGLPTVLKDQQIVTSKEVPSVYINFNNQAQGLTQGQKEKINQQVSNLLIDPTIWSLNIAGDIIIGRTVYEQEARRSDYTSSFRKVKSLLESTDYTIANAEWTAADGIPYPLVGLSFASPAKSLDGLIYAGIDAVSLANNHSMNGGVAAFDQMLKNLQARNIGYFGAGYNFVEAHNPYVANIKGVKVAFLGYTAIPGNVEAGPNPSTGSGLTAGNAFIKITPWYPFTESYMAQMEADIKNAKTKADVVIPFFHWSEEYTHLASEQMRQVAHRAVDAGATMVVGSHPHWVQGVEWYNNHFIAYSLGNFVFDQEQSLKTKQGVVLSTQWSGSNLIDAKFTPIQIEQYYQPHVLEGTPGQEVLNSIYSHSWWPN